VDPCVSVTVTVTILGYLRLTVAAIEDVEAVVDELVGCVTVTVLVLVVYSTAVRTPSTTSVIVDQIVDAVQLVVVV